MDEREAVALQLFLADDPRAGSADLRAARRRHRNLGPADGARLWDALNCGACHAGEDGAFRAPNGPHLGLEGTRARPEWLRGYLAAPRAIRPFGADLQGGRMPDFRLTAAEADSITANLLALRVELPPFEPPALTPFARRKLRTLLEQRLACLGCHALGGRGGRIGPDLSSAAARRTPAYVRALIAAPHQLVPGTSMPTPPVGEALADQLAAYLAAPAEPEATDGEANPAPERAGYLSPLDAPAPEPAPASDPGAILYGRHCAACHGPGGRGDGFNARFLRTTPADHGSAAAMSERTDDRLYDGIAAGAFFLNRSPEMPGFVDLAPADVRALVAWIRRLCSCSGPEWAKDPR